MKILQYGITVICAILLMGRWSQTINAQQEMVVATTSLAQPSLVYGSYLGGDSTDWIRAISTDSEGYLYLTGHTYSAILGEAHHPHLGTMDVFVTKLSPDGKMVLFTTIFGGSGTDEAYDIAVQGGGDNARIWLTGITSSDDFPTLGAFQPDYGGGRDAFVAELSPTGDILFNSYLGSYGSDEAHALAIDSAGNVHLAGSFIGGFFAKVDGRSHNLLYYRMISDQDVTAEDIAIDDDGNLYFTGEVRSADWPVEHAVQANCGASTAGGCTSDAFIVKLNPDGDTILYSTYLGGGEGNGSSGTDKGQRLAIDANGALYVAGETFSTAFPTVNAFQGQKNGPANVSEVFVTKLIPINDGYQIAYSSYLGGEWSEYLGDILLYDGGILITGYTDSAQFPVMAATQTQLGPGICNVGGSERNCADAFVTQVDANGSMRFSAYLGGEYDDVGAALASNRNDSWFVVGRSESLYFPVTADAQQPDKAQGKDLFIVTYRQIDNTPTPSEQIYLPVVSK